MVYYFSQNTTRINSVIDYESDDADYTLLNKDEHVSYRFQILGKLGRGSFGTVVKALDHKTGN